MDYVTQSLVIGLTEYAPLVLAAIGFALLYRLTGLINVAYSETITLGAYFGMWVNTTFGLDFYTVLIPAGLLAGLFSVATYLGIFRPAKRRNVGTLELIIVSFGLSIFLRYGLQLVFGYPVRYFEVPPPETIYVLGVGASVDPLLGWREFLFILLVVLVGLSWGLRGVILVGIGAGVALAAMTLQFSQGLYAQLALIVVFALILKWRGLRLTETGKV